MGIESILEGRVDFWGKGFKLSLDLFSRAVEHNNLILFMRNTQSSSFQGIYE